MKQIVYGVFHRESYLWIRKKNWIYYIIFLVKLKGNVVPVQDTKTYSRIDV